MDSRRTLRSYSFLCICISLIFFSLPALANVEGNKGEVDRNALMNRVSRLQMPFIENQGQIKDRSVRFYANTFTGTVFVTDKGEIVYTPNSFTKAVALKETLVSLKGAKVKGINRSETKVNYFVGDRENWRTDIPAWQEVSLGEVYKGIGLKLRAYGGNIEKVFTVYPEGNVTDIRLGLKGAKGLSVNKDGELEVETVIGILKMTRPFAYQEIDGKRVEVAVNYIVNPLTPPFTKGGQGGFDSELIYGLWVDEYDMTRELIIDPLLASTYIGEIAGWSGVQSASIVIDRDGNIFVAGYTGSPNFPTTGGAYDSTHNGESDVVVSKLNNDLSQLLASTYLGGSAGDGVSPSIAIDSSGNIFVTGETRSSNFPTTGGAYDRTYNGGYTDAYVSKLSNDLTQLLASTYLGGGGSGYYASNSVDYGYAIAIDSSGNVFVTGNTAGSEDFPTTPGAYDRSIEWGDVFVSKLSNNLTELLASTYLGGGSEDWGFSIAIDSSGNIFVTGETRSSNFPTTAGAYDRTLGGSWIQGDAFVSKLSNDLTELRASTYLGGSTGCVTFWWGETSRRDYGRSIAIDSSGNVFVTGDTQASNFPTTEGAYDRSYNYEGASCNTEAYDAFVSKLSNDLTELLASTYLGGGATGYYAFGRDYGRSIAIDSSGNVFVTGNTDSPDFPTTEGAYDRTYGEPGRGSDVFISKLNDSLSSLLASTYLGGGAEIGYSIAIDSIGNVFVAGYSDGNLLTTEGAYQRFVGWGGSAFVSKLNSSLSVIDTLFDANLAETTSNTSNLVETISSQGTILNNVVVNGDLSGTLNFTDFEMVSITTGPFAGKGFSKGEWNATLEGLPYQGSYQGMFFLKESEGKIYLKGTVSGGISGIVEGYLTESTPGSGIYDQYQATWRLNWVGTEIINGTINLNGIVTYQTTTQYPSTQLYALQTFIEGTASGDYKGPLSTVLTHLRVADGGNPYDGQGFSIISYISDSGSGEGWTYDRENSPDVTKLKGLLTSPLSGIVYGTLDETRSPRGLYLTIERIDSGLPPLADLEVKTWGPGWISPGATVNYIIEYRNDGIKSAENTVVVSVLPSLAEYISSTGGGIYRWETHEVIWKLGTVQPQQKGFLSVKVRFLWGLPPGTQQWTLASYGTTTLEKDYFLNPDREPLFNLQDYLAYQPLAISSKILTPEEFTAELSSDVRFNDLYQYAVSLGYSYRVPTKTVLNTGQILTELQMSNPRGEELFLTRVDDTSFLRQYTGTSVSYFDREGGMTMDLTTESFDAWGEWAIPGSPTMAQCIANCMAEGIIPPLTLASASLRAAMCAFDCRNPYSHFCTEDKEFCCKGWQGGPIALIVSSVCIRPCDTETGRVEPVFALPCALREICDNGKCVDKKEKCGTSSFCGISDSIYIVWAKDPNIKYGPEGNVSAGQKLIYKVEYENVGEGIAFGVYFTDTLEEDIDDSTLEIGPVIDVNTGVQIAPSGIYNSQTRTITWFVGEVGPGEGGYAEFSVNVRGNAEPGTEIINFATVYFPSVPEVTRTNGIVSIVPFPDSDGDGTPDYQDGCPNDATKTSPGICGCGVSDADSDGDGIVNCNDGCPDDSQKTAPGICGCGVADTDSDNDSLADCIDACPDIPLGDEICDGIDNNCNGQIDEGLLNTYYQDADSDTYGNPLVSTQACTQPSGYVTDNTDCDDSNGAINIGASDANCNGIDEDCDGTPDDGYVPSGTSCGVGICASTGQLICVSGQTQDTCTPGTPQNEGPYSDPSCSDGLDNDCDGASDGADQACVAINLPDLTGQWTSMAVSQAPTGWLAYGNLSVTNQGNADAGGFVIKFYYIPTGGGPQYLTQRSLLGLLKGAITNVTFRYLFTYNPSGKGSILAVTDANNTVAEGNETNNEAFRNIP